MRIAQILPELNVGGVETGTIDLAKALKKQGHEPYVISNGGKLVSELVKADIPHLQIPVHQKSITALAQVETIARYIERERIDIIHARSRVPAWLAYLAARRTNCDFVTTCHGFYSKSFFSRVMGWGKRVIVISHSVGRRMIDEFNVPPERVTLIHRGVDLSQFQYQPSKYDEAPNDRLRVIVVGRITPIKGHEEFIQAFHLLTKRLPGAEAWIVGGVEKGKEAYFKRLNLVVERLGIRGRIKFLGVRRDLEDLIRQADLLVLPTRIPEAFGRVLIEAGARGTAVAASRIGGILDVVDDHQNGLLFLPEHTEEMAMIMERMLHDRALCKRLSQVMRQKVERQFSLETMVEKTLQVYREVKQEKRVLVMKLGALGDLALAVPTFRMIKKRFPGARVSLVVDPKLMPIVQRCPYLDEFIAFDRSKRSGRLRQILNLGKRLRIQHFDFSIDLQNSWKTHLIAFLAHIPKRYGYRRRFTGFLLSHPVVTWNHKLKPVEHQFQILRRLGVSEFDDTMELWPDPEVDRVVRQKAEELRGEQKDQKLIGFVMGASPKWTTKQWPLDYFVELGRRLVHELNCRIVLIGAAEDRYLAKGFSAADFSGVHDLIGRTSLAELLSWIQQLDSLVTGDTAPLHIASALHTKAVALFGPTEPARHMPPGNDHITLVKPIPCQPCYEPVCKNPKKLLCLRQISVQEVFEAVQKHIVAREVVAADSPSAHL